MSNNPLDSAESQPDPAGCAGRNAGGAYFLPGQQLVAVPAGKNAGGGPCPAPVTALPGC